jgi:hypothetical protein
VNGPGERNSSAFAEIQFVRDLLNAVGFDGNDLDRLCTALRGDRPRLVLEVFGSDSTTTLVFEDGSSAPGPPITK